MIADELDADDLPPYLGERFRDVLDEMLRKAGTEPTPAPRAKPLKAKRGAGCG